MRSTELLSKEWCDLLFEGRNKDYGAYVIRSQAGARYKRVLVILFSFFLLLIGTGTGLSFYMRRLLKDKIKETEAALREMRRSDRKDGYELKFLSTSRVAPAVKTTPGAVAEVPEVVDRVEKVKRVFGYDGPIACDPEEEVLSGMKTDAGDTGSIERPLVKQRIIPTENPLRMPEFPGGARSLMRWLDENIIYSESLVRNHKEGTIIVSFIIGTDGYPVDFEIKDAFDPLVQRVVMNALKRMPRWRPATDENGKAVAAKITVPVLFKL